MKLISGRIVSIAAFLLAVVLLLPGCAANNPTPQFNSGPAFVGDAAANPSGGTNLNNIFTGHSEYKFQVGDEVVVSFSETIDNLLPHVERIKEDGTITMPLIKAVKASGKTAGELQKEIHRRYVPEFYVRMTVVVRTPVSELFYHVQGEVRSPGPKAHLAGTKLTTAISSAGGLTEFARKSRITVTRSNGTKITVDYKKAIENSDKDIAIMPHDRINVPRKWF